MGNTIGPFYFENQRPDYLPATNEAPTFPPDFGFENPRKERVMKISEQEMKALRIPPEDRDYCAHLLVDFYVCRRDKAPFGVLCRNELHRYHDCKFEDYVLRMKEYEREKRLRIRQQKIEGKAVS